MKFIHVLETSEGDEQIINRDFIVQVTHPAPPVSNIHLSNGDVVFCINPSWVDFLAELNA